MDGVGEGAERGEGRSVRASEGGKGGGWDGGKGGKGGEGRGGAVRDLHGGGKGGRVLAVSVRPIPLLPFPSLPLPYPALLYSVLTSLLFGLVCGMMGMWGAGASRYATTAARTSRRARARRGTCVRVVVRREWSCFALSLMLPPICRR